MDNNQNTQIDALQSELDIALQYDLSSVAKISTKSGKNNRKISNSNKRKKKRRMQKKSRTSNR